MNRKCVAHQRSKRRELELLRKKDKAAVREILRLHEELRNVREASGQALKDVTAMCEALIVAAMDGREEIVLYPQDFDHPGKVLGLFYREDGGLVCRLVDQKSVEADASC